MKINFIKCPQSSYITLQWYHAINKYLILYTVHVLVNKLTTEIIMNKAS